jgi:hypothetical protein
MRLLIAGDSYATDVSPYSWCQMLRKSSGWDITNIAKSGTSLAWTYKQLKKQDLRNYDKVMVFLTHEGRLYYPGPEKFTFNYENVLYIFESISTKDEHYNLWLGAKLYYENFYDEEIDLLHSKGIITEISEMGKKIILQRSIYKGPNFGLNILGLHLGKVSVYERSGIDEISIKGKDWRKHFREKAMHSNHLILENKAILAEYVRDIVTTGRSDISYDSFVKIKPEQYDLYFEDLK